MDVYEYFIVQYFLFTNIKQIFILFTQFIHLMSFYHSFGDAFYGVHQFRHKDASKITTFVIWLMFKIYTPLRGHQRNLSLYSDLPEDEVICIFLCSICGL